MKKALRFIWKLIKWLLVTVISLFLLVAIIVHLPPVQDFILSKSTEFFNDKTGGYLTIEEIDLRLPYYLQLEEIHLSDPHSQKVASIGNIEVSLGWRKLLSKTISIDDIFLKDVDANLNAGSEGVWNYQFIVDGFSSSSPDTVPVDSSSPKWDISVSQLRLKNIQLDYKNAQSADTLELSLGKLYTNFQHVSVNEQVFLADKIELSNTNSYFVLGNQGKYFEEKTTNEAENNDESGFIFSVKSVNVDAVQSYSSIPEVGVFDVSLGNLQILVDKVSIEENIFALRQLELTESAFNLELATTESTDKTSSSSIFPDLELRLASLKLEQDKLNLAMEGDSLTHRLALNTLSIGNVAIDSTQYALMINQINLNYNDFPTLLNFSAGLKLTNQFLEVEKLNLATQSSKLKMNAHAEFNDFDSLISSYAFNKAQLEIDDLLLSKTDINQFKKKLPSQDSIPDIMSDIELKLIANSDNEKILISPLELRYGKSTLAVEAHKNSLDFSNYDGEIQSLALHMDKVLRNQILELLNSKSIDIPEPVDLTLSGWSKADSAHVQMDIISPDGSLGIQAQSNISDTSKIPLVLKARTNGFRLGQFLKSSPDAFAKFELEARSENILKYDSSSSASLKVDTIFYQIPIQNIHTDLNISNSVYKAEVSIRDTFIDSDIDAQLSMLDTLSARANININGIDLQGLGLSKTDIRGKTNVFASYNQYKSFRTGEVEISDVVILKENESYDLDPLISEFYIDKDTTDIEINGLLRAYSHSNRDIQYIMERLPGLVNKNYKASDDTSAVWNAEIDVGRIPILREIFIPELTDFSGIQGSLNYRSSTDRIDANLTLPKLKYQNIFVDSLKLTTGTDTSLIQRKLDIKRFGYDTLTIANFSIVSFENESTTDIKIQTKRKLDEPPNYLINCSVQVDSIQQHLYTLTLQDTLILNHEPWVIEQNKIQISDSTVIGNLTISKGQKHLQVSDEEDVNELKISAENFELSDLLSITQQDSLVSGSFSGTLISTSESFKGEGVINNLQAFNASIGDLSWNVDRKDETIIKLSSKQGHLDFNTEGKISFPAGSSPQMDIQTTLNKLDLALFSELYPNYINDANGYIKGNFQLSGNTDKPDYEGSFQFSEAEINSIYTSNNMKINQSQIDLSNDRINLNTITLTDSAGHTLTIKGAIRDYLEPISDVNISIQSNDFELMNVRPEDATLVYGKLIANLDIDISKRLDAPKIRAKIKIAEGTDFTYKVPADETYETFDDDLIEWTSLDTTRSRKEILTREKQKLNSKVDVFANTVDFNGEVEIVDKATLRVLIDSAAGDYLEIRGDAKISMDYDRAGNLRMVGNYYVSDGFYQMNFYNISKRKFKLNKGGYVNWNGDAFNPNLNLSAIYTTRASLINLMTTESGSTVNPAYQQSLPFDVVMSIEGEVEDPEIAFDIRLDKENQGALNGAVDSRLSIMRREQSEMNKQVFALLVFQTFMPSGSSSNPNLIENQARNSASQILSQELNKYSDQFIKGVDVNFDLQSYGGVQGQGNTDLTVDVAKSFFDNRVVVKVGSTIALEQNINTGNTDQFNTNIVVEYLITPDGRYRFLGYSKTNLEDIVVGRITRTGAGIVYQRDFDRFRYLFSPKKRPDSNENTNQQEDKAQE